jgi:hypothetical protein
VVVTRSLKTSTRLWRAYDLSNAFLITVKKEWLPGCRDYCRIKVSAWQQSLGFEASDLSEEQKAALRIAVTHPVSILTGGPGTGKTTCLKSID